jgi:predicted nucleic acid-binding protein
MLVFDATPLIYLAKSEKIEEVDRLEGEKFIPEKVYEEVVEEPENEPDAEKIRKTVEVDIFTVVPSEVEEESDFLSQADLQVLKVAEDRDAVAVMDEENGRNVADVRGIETRGTAFIVLRMQKEGMISQKEAEKIIDRMIDEGWYCSTDLYKEIMKKIEELG